MEASVCLGPSLQHKEKKRNLELGQKRRGMEELLSATLTGVPPNREECTRSTEDTGLHFKQGFETVRYVGGLSVTPQLMCQKLDFSYNSTGR